MSLNLIYCFLFALLGGSTYWWRGIPIKHRMLFTFNGCWTLVSRSIQSMVVYVSAKTKVRKVPVSVAVLPSSHSRSPLVRCLTSNRHGSRAPAGCAGSLTPHQSVVGSQSVREISG